VIIEWRNANGDYDRIPALVADLVQSKVDVILVEEGVRNFVFVGCTLLFEGGTTYGNEFQCD